MRTLSRRLERAGSATSFFFRMAWRNLWRNRKRTVIAGASVFFAVFLAVGMSSVASGQHEYMIQSSVGFYTGHIQIHGKGYWEKRSLDESMTEDTVLLGEVRALPHVTTAVPRFETVALISHGATTRVSPVIGIDPVPESRMTGLGNRIVRGAPLDAWKDGAIVAAGLAKILGADVGDSIVVYGQGYQGVTAAGMIRIAAIVAFPIPDLNNAMVYVPLRQAQDLFAAPGRLTAIALLLDNDESLGMVVSRISALGMKGREVMTWREMMPELVQAIAADNGGTVIMLLILYVVIGFGVFGTVMMMTAERIREFGMTVALGMKRGRLMSITVLESLIISMLGALAGMVASIPFVLYFHQYPIHLGGDYAQAMIAYGLEPIVPFSIDPIIFITQALVMFALGMLSALYPVAVLRKLEPVRAMRG